uniref:Uncharacterized protein n=2 Tax=Rhizophora mucronata TaxID=61149 RepID=A0A2P2LVU6_RHIMU
MFLQQTSALRSLLGVFSRKQKDWKNFNSIGDKMEAIDLISGLPPYIIHHIMSFLELKQVVQTSVLSKTWYRLWECYPILVFNRSLFSPPRPPRSTTKHQPFDESTRKFAIYIDNSLRRFCELKLQIQKFRLAISAIDVELCSMVDKWIELAVETGVREIDLCVLKYGDTSYTLPQTILSARCIKALKIYGCSWMQPFASYNLQLRFLEKLFLGGVYVSEEMILKLTSECPLLEDFSLKYCWGLKCFDVSKSSKVKVVLLEDVKDLKIIKMAALTVRSFTLCCCRTPSCLINVEGCKNLKTLSLLYVDISDLEFHNLISTLPLLEDLTLHSCASPKGVKISSEQLKRLDFVRDTPWEVFEIGTPNLQEFRYRGNEVPCSYSISAPCRWFIGFRYLCTYDIFDCLKLKQFLATGNRIAELALCFGKNLLKLPQLRENMPCLPLEIGNLHLYVSLSESHYTTLLENLLCVCYPKTVSVEVDPAAKVHFYKWFFDELTERDVSCCDSSNVKCWRHYLKAISSKDTLTDADAVPPNGEVRFSLEWHPHTLDTIA